MLHTNLVKIGLVVLERKMLTDDDGRQPTAIGHLSEVTYKHSCKTIKQVANDVAGCTICRLLAFMSICYFEGRLFRYFVLSISRLEIITSTEQHTKRPQIMSQISVLYFSSFQLFVLSSCRLFINSRFVIYLFLKKTSES